MLRVVSPSAPNAIEFPVVMSAAASATRTMRAIEFLRNVI